MTNITEIALCFNILKEIYALEYNNQIIILNFIKSPNMARV